VCAREGGLSVHYQQRTQRGSCALASVEKWLKQQEQAAKTSKHTA
jgi:hypothetical protein